MYYLFLFSPNGEPMLNIKEKGRPRGEEPHFREKIKLHSSSLYCETREEEENPNPAVVDSRKKRRPTRID